MRYFCRALICLFTLFVCMSAVSAIAQAGELPKLQGPILLTSLGQSPDTKTLSVLAKRAKMPCEYVPLSSAADVAKAKTVIVCVGVSLKGFGSAGVNLDSETSRCKEIVQAAKANGAYLVLAHIGGEGRRDGMTNLLLKEFSPHADAFLVYAGGNADKYFDQAAGSKPLESVAKTMEISKVLERIGR